MVNHYETVFVLTPVLSDVQMKETVKKFEDLLKNNGATILNREEWGLKKLAYPIQSKSTGFYILLQFDVEPSFISTFETEFRRDERVIRFLTTRLDKYALEYAEKRMKNRLNKLNEMRENKRRNRDNNDSRSIKNDEAIEKNVEPESIVVPVEEQQSEIVAEPVMEIATEPMPEKVQEADSVVETVVEEVQVEEASNLKEE